MEVMFERLADFWAAGSSTALGLLQGTVPVGSALEAVFVELHLLLGSVDVPVRSCELFYLAGSFGFEVADILSCPETGDGVTPTDPVESAVEVADPVGVTGPLVAELGEGGPVGTTGEVVAELAFLGGADSGIDASLFCPQRPQLRPVQLHPASPFLSQGSHRHGLG